MSYNVLIAEDNKDIVELLKLYLENENYVVLEVYDGQEALNIIENNNIHLAVLDIMMPKLNGYEVTKKIREDSNIPILILSAKNLDSDKILGLGLGADDYLAKPFNPLEVIARVKSLIRRCYSLSTSQEASEIVENSIIQLGELCLNTDSYIVTKNDNKIVLTPTEFRILLLFMKSPGRVYTKAQIGEVIKNDYVDIDDNSIMVHISRIREKIEDNPKEPVYIKTIRGVGYKIERFK